MILSKMLYFRTLFSDRMDGQTEKLFCKNQVLSELKKKKKKDFACAKVNTFDHAHCLLVPKD